MFGLIGRKISHSYSADFFNRKFEREGIKNSYELFPLPSIQDFKSLIESHPELEGLNVTIPYKQEIIPFLNSLSEEANEIGAVNVIQFKRDNGNLYLKGFNTDSIGFEKSLLPLLKPDIKNALILGTGGASKAVAYILKKHGINITFVSRNPKEDDLAYDQLNREIMNKNLLIVNTTPVGMFPDVDGYPQIPYDLLTELHVCYDVVYNPEETVFLKKAKERGATIKNGIEMLRLQALAAWDIWNEA